MAAGAIAQEWSEGVLHLGLKPDWDALVLPCSFHTSVELLWNILVEYSLLGGHNVNQIKNRVPVQSLTQPSDPG